MHVFQTYSTRKCSSNERLCPRGGGGGGGGGGTLIFSYIRRLGQLLGAHNFEFFGGFQKKEYFLGYEDFVEILWDLHKIGLYLGAISKHFRVFS